MVSDLGLAFEGSGLPTKCYAGLPCKTEKGDEGVVLLKRPVGGAARTNADNVRYASA